MKASKQPPEDRPPASTTEAAERLAKIVDAAERAAAQVIDEAEEQGRHQLEEAKARADRLVADHLRTLADELDPPDAEEAVGPPHLKPVEPADDPPEADAAMPRSGAAGARLLATQMAISGISREEIESQLRSRFQLDDTSEILDAILGPED